MDDLKDKTCLVYGFGLETEVCRTLAKKFGKVKGFTLQTDAAGLDNTLLEVKAGAANYGLEF